MLAIYLVNTEDRCVELPAQVMQQGGKGEQLFVSLQPIRSLELRPKQSSYRVDDDESDDTSSEEERKTTSQTHMQGVLKMWEKQVSECTARQSNSELAVSQWTHQIGCMFNVKVVTELEAADHIFGDVWTKCRLFLDQLLEPSDGERVLSTEKHCPCSKHRDMVHLLTWAQPCVGYCIFRHS